MRWPELNVIAGVGQQVDRRGDQAEDGPEEGADDQFTGGNAAPAERYAGVGVGDHVPQ